MNIHIDDLSASSVHTSELSECSTDSDSTLSDSNMNESSSNIKVSRDKNAKTSSKDEKPVNLDKHGVESNRKRARNLKQFSNDEDSSPSSCASKSKIKRK